LSGSVIRLEDVHKRYRVYRQRYQSVKEIVVHRRLGEWQDHWALRGVSLEVQPGTTLGLIGPNGAGKSTALKLMARILTPDRGRVMIARRVSGLLELGAGFQLDYTGRENIYLNASLLGQTRKDIDLKYQAIVDFSELGAAIEDPLRTYSSGMYMRLAFSIAIHVDPEVPGPDRPLPAGRRYHRAGHPRHRDGAGDVHRGRLDTGRIGPSLRTAGSRCERVPGPCAGAGQRS
jgi:ABC-type polysaccharide/polyol phosphate transport system ATPase subunit